MICTRPSRGGWAGSPRPRRSRGFTLIELLAVVMIFGLLSAIALPNFSVRSSRLLRAEARKLQSDLEFARQRAVMTSQAHRLVFDLDSGIYWLESYVHPDAAYFGDEDARPAMDDEEKKVALEAPQDTESEFMRMPGSLGKGAVVNERIQILGIETRERLVKTGVVHILFESDGSSDATAILLATDGRKAILDVEPLADTVSFYFEDS